MTPEQKQAELERHRAILSATLDYLEESLGGSFVYDHYDAVTEYHQQQKLLTEKYFKQRRLDLSPLNTLNADKNEGQQQAVSC